MKEETFPHSRKPSHRHVCVEFWNFSESESRSVVSDSLWLHGLYNPWNSPGQNTGVGSLSLLQGIFPTEGSNPDLLHCRRTLYQLSHQESPKSHKTFWANSGRWWRTGKPGVLHFMGSRRVRHNLGTEPPPPPRQRTLWAPPHELLAVNAAAVDFPGNTDLYLNSGFSFLNPVVY